MLRTADRLVTKRPTVCGKKNDDPSTLDADCFISVEKRKIAWACTRYWRSLGDIIQRHTIDAGVSGTV